MVMLEREIFMIKESYLYYLYCPILSADNTDITADSWLADVSAWWLG